MTVLGLDTATVWATVGLLRDGDVLAERSERRAAGRGPGVEELVDGVLAEAEVTARELDAVAVAFGPGSFTGLRLGIGFAQGFSYAVGCRLQGVSTLVGLAAATPGRGTVHVCLDARKGEVYLGAYAREGAARPPRALGPERALPLEAAVEAIAAAEPGSALVGDAAESHPEAFAGLAVERLGFDVVHPRGAVVARLGAPTDASEPAGRVVPRYLRPSEAERRFAARDR